MSNNVSVRIEDPETSGRFFSAYPPQPLPLWVAERLGTDTKVRNFEAQLKQLGAILDRVPAAYNGSHLSPGRELETATIIDWDREPRWWLMHSVAAEYFRANMEHELLRAAHAMLRGLATMLGYPRSIRRADRTERRFWKGYREWECDRAKRRNTRALLDPQQIPEEMPVLPPGLARLEQRVLEEKEKSKGRSLRHW
jgi:hypothetical protein